MVVQEKLLAPLKLTSGYGRSMALAFKKALSDWELHDKFVTMSFHTIESNTELKNGARHLFEVQLWKGLLW